MMNHSYQLISVSSVSQSSSYIVSKAIHDYDMHKMLCFRPSTKELFILRKEKAFL